MPIHEYFCPDNNRIYQFYAKTLAQAQTIPKCPDNPEYRMVKRISAFAISGSTKKSVAGDKAGAAPGPGDAPPGGDTGDGPGEGMDAGAEDPRMEAALSSMEREMEGIDENDPRAMGRMMRRMSELTGERLDGEMEEMVRKLEEGQDPDKIEEQLGGALGEDAEGMGGGGGGGYGGGPSRDPNLYDY